MLGGVCNGLAAHFNIDVTLVRLAFAVLAIVTAGGWVLAYLLMMLIVPTADTATAKAAAYGESNTAQDFIRRAREGYYEGMKAWGDRHARREWKRRFKRDMRGWRHAFRYEMHENMSQWQANWQRYWSEHPRFHFGLALALPFLSLCRAAITFVWIFAVISLLTTGAVFGILPPAGMPWWVALIVLLVVFNLIVWPFRVLRRSYYFHGLYGPCGSMAFFGLWDTFVWLGFVALLIWLADRYVPQAHHALRNLPAALHHAGESIRQWWSQN